jgi:inorganic pyrophosphatase
MSPSTRSLHPWHDIDPEFDGKRSFWALIEIPMGEKNKYELDKGTGLLKLDRVLHSSVVYPASYGMIPQSLCEDGDPLDVVVLSQRPIHPMTLVRLRAIGLFRMRDQGMDDEKILCVPERDPEYSHYEDVADLPPHRVAEIRQFFLDYSTLEGEKISVPRAQGAGAATRVLKECFKRYHKSGVGRQAGP